MSIGLLFFSILSGLSVFLLAFMPLIPTKAIGKGFFRFNIFLSLLLLVPFIVINPSTWGTFGINVIYVICLIGFLFAPLNRFFYVTTVTVGAVALLLENRAFLPHGGRIWWENIIVHLHFLSSAALFGAVMFAMLLGHWYLVQFDLDKKLLKRVCAVFCWTMALRIVVIAASLLLYWKADVFDSAAFRSLTSLNGHGIFFSMRMGIGLLLPALLCWMIYVTAKMGANQSCTGLLYIAVIFILMGEMVSRYMFFLKGVPL